MVYIYHLKKHELLCTLYYLIKYYNPNTDVYSIKKHPDLLQEAKSYIENSTYISDFKDIKIELDFQDDNYLDETKFDKKYGSGLVEYAATLLRISTLDNIQKNIINVIAWFKEKGKIFNEKETNIKPEDLNYLFHWQNLPDKKLITNCVIINADIFHMVLYNPENDIVYCFCNALYNPMLDTSHYIKEYGIDKLEMHTIASLSSMNNETKVIRTYINENESSYIPDSTFITTETDTEVLSLKRVFDKRANQDSIIINYQNQVRNDCIFKDYFYGDTIIDNQRCNPYSFVEYPTSNGYLKVKYFYDKENHINEIRHEQHVIGDLIINGYHNISEGNFSYQIRTRNKKDKKWDYYHLEMYQSKNNKTYHIKYTNNNTVLEFDIRCNSHDLITNLRELFKEDLYINTICHVLEDNYKIFVKNGETITLAQRFSLMTPEDMEKLSLSEDDLLKETRSYFSKKSGLDLSNNEYTKNKHKIIL